uniref:Uncharacterized protein n=1 Tax=Arundo donax TaxID=35708 RepID=A0A0A8ZDW1_ARUDO
MSLLSSLLILADIHVSAALLHCSLFWLLG